MPEKNPFFRENFDNGLEKAGASFAVYQNDKLVVDLYGGMANEKIGQRWTEHSISVLFSTTKVTNWTNSCPFSGTEQTKEF